MNKIEKRLKRSYLYRFAEENEENEENEQDEQKLEQQLENDIQKVEQFEEKIIQDVANNTFNLIKSDKGLACSEEELRIAADKLNEEIEENVIKKVSSNKNIKQYALEILLEEVLPPCIKNTIDTVRKFRIGKKPNKNQNSQSQSQDNNITKNHLGLNNRNTKQEQFNQSTFKVTKDAITYIHKLCNHNKLELKFSNDVRKIQFEHDSKKNWTANISYDIKNHKWNIGFNKNF